MVTFDFSSAGWKEGVKEFFLSLFKTAVAAVIVYLGVKLDGLHLANFVKPMYALYAGLGLAGVRALMTSIYIWATTTATTVDTVSATEPTGASGLV